MRNFRTVVVVAALAAVALLAPSTAQAAPADKSTDTSAVQLIYGWKG
jgi:hypothetical protein